MNGHEALDKLAFRFFKLFAQYEYALKAMGYGSAGRSGQAEADWDRFSNEIGVAVMAIEAAPIVQARQYILESPPRRQIWVCGAVEWEGVANNDRTSQMLFSHIRRIRNNLYHGGKFNGRWIDPDRSEQLIGNALLLLEALVPLDGNLSDALHGNQA